MPALSRDELRHLAFDGLQVEIELFAGSSPGGRILELDGVCAAICPAAPDRSLFNSAYADTPEQLEAAIDELTATYDEAGVRAWTVWIPDTDRASAELLAARGHVLDGEPRAMAL